MNANKFIVSTIFMGASLIPNAMIINKKIESDAQAVSYANSIPPVWLYNSIVLPTSATTNTFVKINYFARYDKIAKSNWFKRDYSNKSLGEFIYIDE